jgi:undecaprenyl diphosphate synthase
MTDTIDKRWLPRHVAIIMDGNGRWAERQGLPRTAGHKAGADVLRKIARAAGEMGIQAITAYAFSTENWQRPPYEVNFLMNLLDFYLERETNSLKAENVKVIFSGELSGLPPKVRERAEKTRTATAANSGLVLNLAVNYGARAEILRAVNLLLTDQAAGRLTQPVSAGLFASYLYTAGLPDLDLLIRPGGDMRISNFLLWQAAYAEIWFTDTFWPDFTEQDFCRALTDYQRRDRRFGRIKTRENGQV